MDNTRFSGATLVFDLDGTLVDTAPDLIRALNAVLREESIPLPDADGIRHLVGHGARALLERGAAHAGVLLEGSRLDRLTERFITHYRADIALLSRPFPGAPAALDTLAQAGATLAVCTNKRTDLSIELLEALGLRSQFRAIVGADAVAHRKPDPEHLLETISRVGGTRSRAIMIGDTDSDILAARAAKIPSIAVRFGYTQYVDALRADAILEDYSALSGLIARLLP